MQDSGECVGALGQLGETMLHETKANDQTQRNGSPTGDRKSTQRIERNVPQRFLSRCFSIRSSYHCILVVLIVPFSSSAPRRTCSQPLAVFSEHPSCRKPRGSDYRGRAHRPFRIVRSVKGRGSKLCADGSM